MRKIFIIINILIITLTSVWGQNAINNPAPVPVPPEFRNINDREIRISRKLSKASKTTADTTFYIRDSIGQNETIKLVEENFSQEYSGDTINIWVEQSELDSPITNNDIESIRKELLEKTPKGSIDTTKGIYANELDFIGEPPYVDGNKTLDVLMIDVRDYWEEGDESYIAGYFDPIDQIPSSMITGIEESNLADIIYIDTDPAFINQDEPPKRVLSTVAHELQHLIHWNYHTNESTWMNESISTLMPRVLGLSRRKFSRFLRNPNRKLNTFDNSLKDYSKVALWSFYNYKRFGGEFIRNIVHSDKSSFNGYDEVINNSSDIKTTPMQIVEDWFIANIVNLEDGKYGYKGASIPTEVDTARDHKGPVEELDSIEQQNNAASYIQFTDFENIDFEINNKDDGDLRLAVIKHTTPPEINIEEFTGSRKLFSDSSFGIDYDTLSIIPLNNEREVGWNSLSLSYRAPGEDVGVEQDLAELDKFKLKKPYPNPFNPSTNIRFKIPRSEKVVISVYNMLGQKVENLVSKEMKAGQYGVQWKAGNLASGAYLIRLKAGNYTEVKRSVLLK